MKTALLIYANGSEDLEITATADILNRGGVQITRAALNDTHDKNIKLAHGTTVVCDKNLEECNGEYDIIVIPGGLEGSEHCRDSKLLVDKLKKQHSAGKMIAAICAAPGFVLNTHGFLKGGVKATCYPGCNDSGIEGLQSDGVVYDENAHIITGKGPGFAIDFALKILEVLVSPQVKEKVASGMLVKV